MNFQILRKIIDEHLELFKNISEETWKEKSSPEKWSRKEILGHLIDSGLTNIRRFVVTQYQENDKIIYDQNFWVKAQNYQNTETSDIINLWKFLNYQIVNVVENIQFEVISNTCETSEIVTLEFIIEDYIQHLIHHLNKILNK